MILDSITIKEMFKDMEYLIFKMEKADYIKNFEKFQTKYTTFFSEMISSFKCAGQDNDIPGEFFEIAFSNFKRFGKVRKSVKIDMSMFLIYYVFPLILKIEKESPDENGILLSKALSEKWIELSENPKFSYADYETIRDSFVKTMFGFKVGD